MISAKIIADSISPIGVRLITFQLQYPRFIHSELMTHRVFSRNAASSRAIPVKKMIEQVENDPALPVWWGKNQPGMQAREELDHWEPKHVEVFDGNKAYWEWVYSPRDQAKQVWMDARQDAVKHAKRLVQLDTHKQIVNRLLEPWQEMQSIVTATEWSNFFNLRRHPDAQPEIKALADGMWTIMQNSSPKQLNYESWHLPYVESDPLNQILNGGLAYPLSNLRKWSVARCARVSYLNHDKSDPVPEKDEVLHEQLLTSGHFSPFEHQATPSSEDRLYANFRAWRSYRFDLGF